MPMREAECGQRNKRLDREMRFSCIASLLLCIGLMLGCTPSATVSRVRWYADGESAISDGIHWYLVSPDIGDTIWTSLGDAVLGSPAGQVVVNGQRTSPFSPRTPRLIVLASDSVSARILSVRGDTIAEFDSKYLERGVYGIGWGGDRLPSGVYFSEFTYGDTIQQMKWVLLK